MMQHERLEQQHASDIAMLDGFTKPQSIRIEKEEGGLRPQADILIDIGLQDKLFHDEGMEAYVAVDIGTRVAVWSINSDSYKEHLSREYFELTDKGCNRNSLADATNTLSGHAKYKGDTEPVYLRIGKLPDGIAIDICDETGRAIVVTKKGWSVVEKSPVNFRRSGKVAPLPIPSNNSNINLLWKYLNVSESERVLVLAWLLGAFKPNGPYPIALVIGEQGSGKSFTSMMLKSLVDPSVVPLRGAPREERDLLAAANSSWCVALDNLSATTPQIADFLCRISTGGGIAARRLYTDMEESLIQITRPMVFNGINDIASRPDLADRCISMRLPLLTQRKTEAEIKASFKKDAPAIMAALLDALSMAIREHSNVKMQRVPRMADFAKWAAAGLPAIGYSAEFFESAYHENRSHAVDNAIESSPIGNAVLEFMSSVTEWQGGSHELLSMLTARNNKSTNEFWPKTAKKLINDLERIAPALRKKGINYIRSRTNSQRFIQLCKVENNVSHVSQTSPNAPNSDTCDACDTLKPTLHDNPPLKNSDIEREVMEF